MAGISVAPFNRPLYEWVERHGPGGANVPLREAFDKLTLRGGFGEEDEYLLLDGISTFAHGHEDGNSIERLTWKGRMWLAETDYIWKRPRHHSSVVSICNGESRAMPSLAARKWTEDFGETAFTRTRVPDYNGVNWTRDLFWLKGQYILVADSLELNEDADYDLRCLWRTLGDVRPEGDDLTVEQEGVFFRIRNADDSDKVLETEEPRVAGQDPYSGYDYADGPIRIFRQRKALHGRPGDVERYFNLMVAGTEEEIDAHRIVRIGEGMVRIEGRDGPTLFGLAADGLQIGPLRMTAEVFALTDTSLLLLNGTRLSAGEASFESDTPVHLVVHPGEGRGEIRTSADTSIAAHNIPGFRIDGNAVAASSLLTPGSHTVSLGARPSPVPAEAIRSGTLYTHHRAPRENRFVPSTSSPLRTIWERRVKGAVRCVDAKNTEIAAGTATGQVVLLDREGHVRWTHETGAEVRTVHLAHLDSGGGLLAGGRDCALTLFDRDGQVRWRRPFMTSHARDQIVNAIRTADLTGDGRAEIVVATDGWLVWALTADGEEIWQRQIEHHAAGTLAISDVEGDGRQEILVGTEYHTSNMLEADGRIRWTVRGGPCFTALALADLNGDGVQEAIYGAMDGNVYTLDALSGRMLWAANLGDDVRHGAVVRAGGESGFVAGSESGNLALLNPDGHRRWRRDLNAAVTGVVVLEPGANHEAVIAAGTSEGWLVLLSSEGEILGSHRTEAGVTALISLILPDGPGLLVGTEGGHLAAYTNLYFTE